MEVSDHGRACDRPKRDAGGRRGSRGTLVFTLLAVLTLTLVVAAVALAAVSGPNYGTGTSVYVDGADTDWSNPGNVGADDASHTTARNVPRKGGTTNLLVATDFGFAIPSRAAIDGITVEIDRVSSGTDLRDNVVQLTQDGSTLIGDNLAATGTDWPTVEATATYRGPTSLWGATWTAPQVNSPDFGVALQARNAFEGAPGKRTADVDFIRVAIDYTELAVPLPVTVTATAADKVYDGSTAAHVTLESADLLPTDNVTIEYTSAEFDGKDAGAGKPVTVEGITLTGPDAGQFVLTADAAETTAAITPAELTVSGAVAADKAYDGTTDATVDFTAAVLDGVVEGDDVALISDAYTAAFASEDVGADIPVTVDGLTVEGADGANYTLSQPVLAAAITPAEVAVTATVADKAYDGTTVADVTLESADVIDGDDVVIDHASAAFAGKDVGDDIPVSVEGIALTGDDAGNYTLLNETATGSASITPAELTVTADDQTKIYKRAFTFTGAEFGAAGLVAGEGVAAVTLTSAGAAAAATPGPYPIVASDAQPAVGTDLDNYAVAYQDGTLTVVGGMKVGPFAKPLRPGDPRRLQRGRTIRVAFRIRDFAGKLVKDAAPKLKVMRSGRTVVGPKTVKYNATARKYILNLRIRGTWRLATYKLTVTLGPGNTGRRAWFRVVR